MRRYDILVAPLKITEKFHPTCVSERGRKRPERLFGPTLALILTWQLKTLAAAAAALSL